MNKKVYIETFGCQMNVHDSDRMKRLFRASDYDIVDDAKKADAVILNTCSIRDKAEHKVLTKIGRLKSVKKVKKNLIIGIAGCMAQRLGEELLNRYPHVNLVFGTHVIPDSPRLLDKAFSDLKVVETNKKNVAAFEFVKIPLELKSLSKDTCADVTIMNGCDNYCSYCVVPYTRGPEVSREPGDILREIKLLVERGVREVTLLGQNVNSYGNKADFNMGFCELLKEVVEFNKLKRVRFVTSHPKDMSDKLIDLIASEEKICNHIHLPVQSGSNKILKMMKRNYSREHYLGLIKKLRSKCPSIAITTDIIVAYPGETKKDAKDTIDLVRKVRYDGAFSFKFDPRPGTKAAELGNPVDPIEAQDRLAELQELQINISYEKNKELIGSIQEILVEGKSRAEGQFFGRSQGNKIVNFKCDDQKVIGNFVRVKITKANKNSLTGDFESIE